MRIKPPAGLFCCVRRRIDIAAFGGLSASPSTALMPSPSPTPTGGKMGFVRYTPAAALNQMEQQAVLDSRPKPEELTGLYGHVRRIFEINKRGRLEVEQEMLRALRRIQGKYEADKQAAIDAMGGSDIFIRLTQQKCRDAEAWILDVLNPAGDRTWDIEPTPIADIPPNIMQMIRSQALQQFMDEIMQGIEAQAQAEAQQTGGPITPQDLAKYAPPPDQLQQQYQQREDEITEEVKKLAQQFAEEKSANMQNQILDQMIEGGFHEAFKAVVNDICHFKMGILEGPVFVKEKNLEWQEDPTTGQWTPNVTETIIPKFYRIPPFDWYPTPDSLNPQDGDNIVLGHHERKDITKLLGTPGYKDDAIRLVLSEYPTGYKENTTIMAERHYLEHGNTSYYDSTKYDMLNFWGSVPGNLLLEYGMDAAKIPDPDLDYQVNIKSIGRHVIKAVLNPDPLGKAPFGGTSFRKSNDSQWGECPADLMEDLQDMCNQPARAIQDNVAWASRPMAEVNRSRLIPGETADLWPGRVYEVTDSKMGENVPVVRFYQPSMNTDKLLMVYDKFKREADDIVVPSYAHGDPQVGGAGNTASGLSMLMSAAARNIKLAIGNIDTDVIIPAVERLFAFNMRYIDDPSIKGDAKVKARGTASLMAKEQLAVRRNELLTGLNNPVDVQITGTKGRAFLIGEAAKSVELPVDKVVPGYDKIESAPDVPQPTQPRQALPPGQGGSPVAATRALDQAGNPVSGQDTAVFQEEEQ